MKKIFPALIFLCAALAIYSEYFARRFVYIFKPLTMIFIIAFVWLNAAAKSFYVRMIVAGLIFSLVGDCFLINPQSYFLFGLVSFLIAHLFYTAAFFKVGKENFNLFSLVAYVVGSAVYLLVSGGVPENLKIAVIVYALVISTMLAAAFNFWLTKKMPAARLALTGAFLFVISDSLLAYNRFVNEFFFAKLLILVTYFIAQFLIAGSTPENQFEDINAR